MIPPVPKNLTLISLHQDEDHYLNRLESVIDYISDYEGDEEWEYVRTHLEIKLIECKLLYLVWRDEEY